MNRADLDRVLARHAAWLRGDPDGERANLRDADLRNADMRNADLRVADLTNADLSGADLRNADLSSAVLRGADLTNADLRNADLTGSGADVGPAITVEQLAECPTLLAEVLRQHGLVADLLVAALSGHEAAHLRHALLVAVDQRDAAEGLPAHEGVTT